MIAGDAFNGHRIGLDHLGVASMAELEAALALLDARCVPRGKINSLTAFGIAVLAFRDPDNIPMELTAPLCVVP